MSNHVVIIEDNPDILDLLVDFLADHGIVAIGLPPRLPLLECLPRPPEAMLIDLMLPGTSGIEVAAEVRRLFPGVPLVAMSASRLMLELAAGSGLFDAHLAKPFDLGLLLEAVRAAIAVGAQAPSFAAS